MSKESTFALILPQRALIAFAFLLSQKGDSRCQTYIDHVAAMAGSSIRGVIFDIGGVVVGSPFEGISAYEKEFGIPSNYINVVMCASSPRFTVADRSHTKWW